MNIPHNRFGQPDLGELVARHAGFDKIPAEIWLEFDRAMMEWQKRRRDRTADALPSDRPAPERLCVCGSPGEYWRPRKGGGPAIWRCEAHRDQWPDYAEDFPLRKAAQ